MHAIAHHAALAVYKRAFNDGAAGSSSSSSSSGQTDNDLVRQRVAAAIVLVIIANFILFIPVHIFMNYTVAQVFPVLAVVESEEPPAYEPVALNDDDNTPKPFGTSVSDGGNHALTSSLRGCYRLLRAEPGFRGHLRAALRGIACSIVEGFLGSLLFGIFLTTLGHAGTPLATLLASLCLVQFSTAWVHIVMTPSSSLNFLQRLPPFGSTFKATWKPVVLAWVAGEITRWTPFLAALLMGVRLSPYENPLPKDNPKQLIAILLGAIVLLCTVVPAHIILIRVQASLLPPDEETLVPFDRSFQGKLAPAIAGGGAATIKDAWSTFSRASLIRLTKLYAKIVGVVIAYSFAFGCILGIQLIFLGLVGGA